MRTLSNQSKRTVKVLNRYIKKLQALVKNVDKPRYNRDPDDFIGLAHIEVCNLADDIEAEMQYQRE